MKNCCCRGSCPLLVVVATLNLCRLLWLHRFFFFFVVCARFSSEYQRLSTRHALVSELPNTCSASFSSERECFRNFCHRIPFGLSSSTTVVRCAKVCTVAHALCHTTRHSTLCFLVSLPLSSSGEGTAVRPGAVCGDDRLERTEAGQGERGSPGAHQPQSEEVGTHDDFLQLVHFATGVLVRCPPFVFACSGSRLGSAKWRSSWRTR